MKLAGIIFDLDGTLIDSREIVLGAFKHVLEEFSQPYDQAAVMSHVGRTLDDSYLSLLPTQDPKVLAEMHRAWQQDNHDLLKDFSGLDEFLQQLKNQGLKLGVYTSAFRSRAELALDGLNIRESFDAIVCGDEVKKPKPDKEGIVTVTNLLGLKPSQVVMVGDSKHDILSGKHAGVLTIGITHGFGTKKELEEAGADYLVSNLQELLEKLSVLNNDGS